MKSVLTEQSCGSLMVSDFYDISCGFVVVSAVHGPVYLETLQEKLMPYACY